MPVWKRVAILLASTVLLVLALWPVAWTTRGTKGCAALALASVICAAGGVLAMLVGERFRGPHYALAQVGVGSMSRMGIALAAGLNVARRDEQMVRAGFVFYLIVAFLLLLLVDVMLTMAVIAADDQHEMRSNQA